MANLLKRGSTYFVRLTIPRDRWADVGRAMIAAGGLKREVVRTLQTGDYREAQKRREAGLAAAREMVDAALRRARLEPLTDWTADWAARAIERREQFRAGEDRISGWVRGPGEEPIPVFEAGLTYDTVETDAKLVETRQGSGAAHAFMKIATATELSVAEAGRHWLASVRGAIREGTLQGYEASIGRLGVHLAAHEGLPTLEVVGLSQVTRRMAGAVIEARRAQRASETVQRDFSAWNGLWRWAVRRGHTDLNPWTDQTAGMKAPRADEEDSVKRAYTPAELVALIRADASQLAPNGGGYGPALWDTIRLALLTGARAGELIGLRVGDVIEDGTAIATLKRGKTDAASRIIPLHALAQEVHRARLESLTDRSPNALLWPDVAGADQAEKRAKTLSSRFVMARRRILGDDDGADLHSLRRNWMTAAETAHHEGGRINPELIDLIGGHKRGRMSFDLYSEWSRMGRRLVGGMADKLVTLRAAVDDTVEVGLPREVLTALEETRGSRPKVVRVKPAFSRKLSG